MEIGDTQKSVSAHLMVAETSRPIPKRPKLEAPPSTVENTVPQEPLPEAHPPIIENTVPQEPLPEAHPSTVENTVPQEPLPEAHPSIVENTVPQEPLPEAHPPIIENTVPQEPLPEAHPSTVENTMPLLLPDTDQAVQTLQRQEKKGRKLRSINKHEMATAEMFKERCRQLCLTAFFRENNPVRSLGFTSSIAGEGKSFLSAVTAQILAEASTTPVTLLECNWERSSLHEYFGIAPVPGFAEWIRNESSATAIRHQVGHNLTFVPAGDSKQVAAKLLQKIRQNGLMKSLTSLNELLIVELPTIVTTGYGSLAASLVESIIIVVHAGVTPDGLVSETCAQLKDLPVEGILLNQIESRIPRWLQRII